MTAHMSCPFLSYHCVFHLSSQSAAAFYDNVYINAQFRGTGSCHLCQHSSTSLLRDHLLCTVCRFTYADALETLGSAYKEATKLTLECASDLVLILHACCWETMSCNVGANFD